MPEFTFTGSVVLRGVTFFIEAENENAAKIEALNGLFDRFEADCAETADATLDVTSCQINE